MGYQEKTLVLFGFCSKTRMHSSRMRTGRTWTVFQSLLFGGGVTCLVGGGYLPGPGRGVWSWGVSGPGGYLTGLGGCLVRGVPSWSQGGVPTWSQGGVPTWSRGVPGQVLPPPVNRMTHTCKNITLAKTSFRPENLHTDVQDKCSPCIYNTYLKTWWSSAKPASLSRLHGGRFLS